MLNFDNRLLRELPGEAESSNQPHAVHGALWSPVSATPVAAPRLLACSRDMAQQLGIDETVLASPQWLSALAGKQSDLFSLTRAAVLYCKIINPEFNPVCSISNLGSPGTLSIIER